MIRPKRGLVAPALVILFALAACGRNGPATERVAATTPAPSASAAPSSAIALSPSPSTSAEAMPAKPMTHPEEASAALDESTMERLVFREVFAGRYTGNWRRTWILYRSGKRAQLDVLCQNGVEMIPLTGKENDESAWRAPVLMRYAGTHDREGTSTYRVALTSGTAGKSECDWMPDTIVLSCRLETIAVRRAGTAVMLDHTSEGWSSHWASSAGERVAGLRCEGLTNKRFEWPLVFVAPRRSAPGIEWAFQHDDIVQAGALRWMPALE
jgi:hypothetical protein